MQTYNVGDIRTLQFDSESEAAAVSLPSARQPYTSREAAKVGGPNAGHKVFQDPTPYTHHQLPSGTRFSEARLLIGSGAVVNAEKLLKEIAECKVDAERLSIDPQVMIIGMADIKAEERLVKSIGSTGQGVGNATARRILKRGEDSTKLARDIPELKPFIRPACDVLDKAFFQRKRVFVEGTQGTGLSLYHGSYPHVTSRDTTVAGCLSEAGISRNGRHLPSTAATSCRCSL